VESGEWRVESGEWRVESGEWRVESGEWRVGSGEWEVGSGEWRVESGKWKVESGKWKVESGKWKVGAARGRGLGEGTGNRAWGEGAAMRVGSDRVRRGDGARRLGTELGRSVRCGEWGEGLARGRGIGLMGFAD
jgi:hypothetical protein